MGLMLFPLAHLRKKTILHAQVADSYETTHLYAKQKEVLHPGFLVHDRMRGWPLPNWTDALGDSSTGSGFLVWPKF